MYRKFFFTAIAASSVAIGGFLVASLASSPRAVVTPNRIEIAGPDGKPVVAVDGTTITLTAAQLQSLPNKTTVVTITPEIAAQRGLDTSDIGGELVIGDSVAVWQIIGAHPASQAAADAAIAAAAAKSTTTSTG